MSFPIGSDKEELKRSVKVLERLEQLRANMRKLAEDIPVARKIIVTRDQYRMFELAGMCMDDVVIGDFKVEDKL